MNVDQLTVKPKKAKSPQKLSKAEEEELADYLDLDLSLTAARCICCIY